MDFLLIDKRVVERNIEKGTITREECEKYCDKLPDLTDECEEVEVSLYKTDDEEETNEDEATEEGDPMPVEEIEQGG